MTLRSCAWRTRLLNPSSDSFSRLLAITPVKLGTASMSNSISMKIERAISISVKPRSEEHTSELQSHVNLVCRLLLEKKKTAMEIVIFTYDTLLLHDDLFHVRQLH